MGRQRRRGEELENDILERTFELIKRTKYEDLTMDMIAKNAHTNKNVLYRRWDSKADLVMAALQSQITDFHFVEPDTGSIHGDLVALFDSIFNALDRVNYQNMIGLIKERFGAISMVDYFQKLGRRNYLTQIVRRIFIHAEERGEVNMTLINESLYDLPVLLTLDMLFGDDRPVTRVRLHEMIDEILMPVFKRVIK